MDFKRLRKKRTLLRELIEGQKMALKESTKASTSAPAFTPQVPPVVNPVGSGIPQQGAPAAFQNLASYPGTGGQICHSLPWHRPMWLHRPITPMAPTLGGTPITPMAPTLGTWPKL